MDGDITADDATILTAALDKEDPRPLTENERKVADVNKDGAITEDDLTALEQLIADLAAFPPEQRTVHYICSLVLIWPDGRTVTAEGSCDGILRDFYAGQNGFGYDPLFYVPDKGKTMAELSMAEKNEISHRGKALKKLVEALS